MFRKSSSRVIVIAATFVLGAPALYSGVAVAAERPFKAMWTGNAHLSPTENLFVLRNDETGEGEANHLGRFTWASVEFVDFAANPGGVVVDGRSFTMTAANGDQMFGTYATVGFPNEAGNLIIHGTFTIRGGTGRFVGATGGGNLFAIAFLSEGLPFIGMYDGTIDY